MAEEQNTAQAIGALTAQIEAMNNRLDRVEPVADMVTGWRARFAGAMIVLGFIGTLAILGFGFFKDSILRLIFGT